MLTVEYVTQPLNRIDYLCLFRRAVANASFTHFDVAVAYATSRGVQALDRAFRDCNPDAWQGMHKRWLVGVDWYRTQPTALRELAALDNSEVRIHEGRAVMARTGCQPELPFHPKTFLLRGPDARAAVVGSGNLSRNGLTRGHECGSLLVCRDPIAAVEEPMNRQVLKLSEWFSAVWDRADGLDNLLDDYTRQFESAEHMGNPTPTEDDAASTERLLRSTGGRRAIRPDQLRKLRVATHLWIDSGNLHLNRGPGRPGNQLMMSPMTRVFFGFDADDVATDTFVGDVAIEYDEQTRPDCSLRFSNNSMDVLTLPVPGGGGPLEYDRKVLHFLRLPGNVFRLSIGERPVVRSWHRRSEEIDALFRMTSEREWGVY